MSMSFVHAPSRSSIRRLNIRLPDNVWQELDALVANSEKEGGKIDLEATVAAMIESLVRAASGGGKRRRKKEGGEQQ